MPERNRESGRI